MDSFRELMLMPDSARREDMVTDLSLAVVAEQGWSALTMRAVADRVGCTRQAIQQWFGGQQDLRRVVAVCFVARWQRWVSMRVHAYGVRGLLPDSDEVLMWCRVRLALIEHAHREEWLADLAALLVEQEREAVARWLGSAPGDVEVAVAHALVCAPPSPEPDATVAGQMVDFYLLARKQVEIGGFPSKEESATLPAV